MNDFYNNDWYDARWESLAPEVRARSADAVRSVLSTEDRAMIVQRFNEVGKHEWIHQLIPIPEEMLDDAVHVGMALEGDKFWSGHHIFGTSIRNVLRHQVCRDEELPLAPYEDGGSHRNWDDFYVSAIEAAVGVRNV